MPPASHCWNWYLSCHDTLGPTLDLDKYQQISVSEIDASRLRLEQTHRCSPPVVSDCWWQCSTRRKQPVVKIHIAIIEAIIWRISLDMALFCFSLFWTFAIPRKIKHCRDSIFISDRSYLRVSDWRKERMKRWTGQYWIICFFSIYCV